MVLISTISFFIVLFSCNFIFITFYRGFKRYNKYTEHYALTTAHIMHKKHKLTQVWHNVKKQFWGGVALFYASVLTAIELLLYIAISSE